MDGTKPNREPAKVELWNINATSSSVVRWSSALLLPFHLLCLFHWSSFSLCSLTLSLCFPSFFVLQRFLHSAPRTRLPSLPCRVTCRHMEQRTSLAFLCMRACMRICVAENLRARKWICISIERGKRIRWSLRFLQILQSVGISFGLFNFTLTLLDLSLCTRGKSFSRHLLRF